MSWLSWSGDLSQTSPEPTPDVAVYLSHEVTSWTPQGCLPLPWSNSTDWGRLMLHTSPKKRLHRLRQTYVTYISQEVTAQTEVNLCYLPKYLSHEATAQTRVDLCYLPLPWSDYRYWGRFVTYLSHEAGSGRLMSPTWVPLPRSDCTDSGRLMLPTSPMKWLRILR